MDIARDCVISFSAELGVRNPKGVHIGEGTMVGSGARILTYDDLHQIRMDTRIGKNCHVSTRSLIFPGVEIGDHSIVQVGSVVMNDVPPNCLVSGHPAQIIERGIQTGRGGIINRVIKAEFGRASAKSANKPMPE
jgi:acetyltransferase-like isoleucine patch superfamily enzyme